MGLLNILPQWPFYQKAMEGGMRTMQQQYGIADLSFCRFRRVSA